MSTLTRRAYSRLLRSLDRRVAPLERKLHALRHAAPIAMENGPHVFHMGVHSTIAEELRSAAGANGIRATLWDLSERLAWTVGRRRTRVAVINEETWGGIDRALIQRFHNAYGEYLDSFQGYMSSHPMCFSLLYERFARPTLAMCSTRYEVPFTSDFRRWLWLDEEVSKGTAEGWLTVVANNRTDADYVRNYTSIDVACIPSASSYVGATYTGTRSAVLVTSLRDALAREVCGSLVRGARPLRTELGVRYSWQDLYDQRALVLIPYNTSLMSLFEHYSACMPIYVPTKGFLKDLMRLYPDDVLSQLSFSQVTGTPAAKPPPGVPDLNAVADPAVVDWYLERADFYSQEWMPHIRQFESWSHLSHLIATDDYAAISEAMVSERPSRLARIAALWEELAWTKALTAAATNSIGAAGRP